MKNKKELMRRGSKDGLHISYATIGAIVGLLAILTGIWRVGSAVATKSDIDSATTSIRLLISSITPVLDKHEDRIRTLELQMARYFGASQSSFKPSDAPVGDSFPALSLTNWTKCDDRIVSVPAFQLAQYSQSQTSQSAPSASSTYDAKRQLEFPRRVVVPQLMIKLYDLQPSRGGVYALLGEDGRYYALDDVMAVIIRMHFEEHLRK